MKSNFLRPDQAGSSSSFSRVPVSTSQLVTLRPTMSTANIEATMPRVSEIAKPLIGPVACQNRMTAVISVVTFASKIELNALS